MVDRLFRADQCVYCGGSLIPDIDGPPKCMNCGRVSHRAESQQRKRRGTPTTIGQREKELLRSAAKVLSIRQTAEMSGRSPTTVIKIVKGDK